MRRLRTGKCQARGGVPQGNSREAGAAFGDLAGEARLARRIVDPQPAAEDRHRRAVYPGQRPAVRRGIDAAGEARHHRHPGLGEGARERFRHLQAVGVGLARAYDRDRQPQRQLTLEIQHRRRQREVLQAGRIPGLARGDDPRPQARRLLPLAGGGLGDLRGPGGERQGPVERRAGDADPGGHLFRAALS